MLVKKWECSLTHGESCVNQNNYSVFFLVLVGIFQKNGGSFFCGNSGGVGRLYLLVAPIFKGWSKLMVIIPHFNGSTTWLTSLILNRYSFFSKAESSFGINNSQPFLLPSLSLFLLLLFLVHCKWPLLQGDR